MLHENLGKLTVISGAMFSDKSGTLISYCIKAKTYQKLRVAAIKPATDTRGKEGVISSRTAGEFPAMILDRKFDVKKTFKSLKQNDVIGIDEAQFFDSSSLIELVKLLLLENVYVIASGLNMDYSGEPFETTLKLMCMADEVQTMYAYCEICGKPAVYTQLKVNNKPIQYKLKDNVFIGDSEYAPRCRNHFVAPE